MAHDGVDITPLDMPDMKFGAKSAPLRSPSRIIPFLFGRRLTLHITSHELSVSGPSLHCEAIIMAPRATDSPCMDPLSLCDQSRRFHKRVVSARGGGIPRKEAMDRRSRGDHCGNQYE